MRIRVLGCSGGVGGGHRTTSLLVDEDILIDCGTGVGDLAFEALLKIDHVFITHSHLDHIALLPMLVDTVGEQRGRPITIYACDETVRILRAHIFNWLIWPDFTAIPDRNHPLLRFQSLKVGESVWLDGRCITSMPAMHSVPAVGYALSGRAGTLAFSGDTTVCDEQLAALNAIENLRYLMVETAFSNAHQDLAHAARHLSPSMLHSLLDRLTGTPEVFVTHLKPAYFHETSAEVLSYSGPLKIALLDNGRVFEV